MHFTSLFSKYNPISHKIDLLIKNKEEKMKLKTFAAVIFMVGTTLSVYQYILNNEIMWEKQKKALKMENVDHRELEQIKKWKKSTWYEKLLPLKD